MKKIVARHFTDASSTMLLALFRWSWSHYTTTTDSAITYLGEWYTPVPLSAILLFLSRRHFPIGDPLLETTTRIRIARHIRLPAEYFLRIENVRRFEYSSASMITRSSLSYTLFKNFSHSDVKVLCPRCFYLMNKNLNIVSRIEIRNLLIECWRWFFLTKIRETRTTNMFILMEIAGKTGSFARTWSNSVVSVVSFE